MLNVLICFNKTINLTGTKLKLVESSEEQSKVAESSISRKSTNDKFRSYFKY